MAPLGASSITTALERFRYNNFNAFALRYKANKKLRFKIGNFVSKKIYKLPDGVARKTKAQ
jgi:hypothetical protein